MDSPTKEIRERLSLLKLQPLENINNSNKLNLAHNVNKPQSKAVVNSASEHDKENYDQSDSNTINTNSEDTVVHNRNSQDNTLPDWLQVKMRLQSSNDQISERQKPKIISSVKTHVEEYEKKASAYSIRPQLVSKTMNKSEDVSVLYNTTWEQMKRNYDIENDDLYSRIVNNNSEDETANLGAQEKHSQEEFNNTAYSFQDDHHLRVSSDIPSNVTAKVTSFRSNYVDSPMAQPKLIRRIFHEFDDDEEEIEVIDDSSFNNLKISHDPIMRPASLQEVRLITPVDEGMIYDSNKGQWVYPNQWSRSSSLSQKYDSQIHLEEDEEEDTHGQINEDAKTAGKGYDSHDMLAINKTQNNNTTSLDPRHVTNVSQLDLSFSESRKYLINVLNDVIKPNHNWDEVRNVDISGKDIVTVKSLEEFLPKLIELDASSNSLTSLEGISYNLQKISLSHNQISDQFLNFQKLQFLQKLDLSYNKVKRLSLFQHLKNLRELYLSSNEIDDLVNLPNVQILDLSKNKIKNILSFKELEFNNLVELDLSNNDIRQINDFGIKTLRVLKLDNNENLDGIQINEALPNLKKLSLLGDIKLQNVDIGSKMKHLRSLSIHGQTQIRGELPDLQELNLSNDLRLERLKDTSLKVNEHLLTISLRNSNLEFKDLSGIADDFPHLQRFDFSDNLIDCKFTEFVEFFHRFSNVKKIKLDNNPLVDKLKGDEDMGLFRLMIYKLLNNNRQ